MHLIMKTIDKVSILCILALAVSCGQKNEEPAPVKPEVQPETRTLTFVLPSVEVEEGEEAPSALKSAWQAYLSLEGAARDWLWLILLLNRQRPLHV